MLYFLTIWEMIIAFLKRNSKLVTFTILITLFLIATFSYGTADFSTYEGRYYYYDVDFLFNQTEPLYTLIVRLARMINLPYRGFLALEYAFILFSFAYFVKKSTDNVNFVLFLYIIWPFCRDVVVLRTTLGVAFVYIGFPFLLKGGKRNLVKYILCVLVGGLVHYSMLFFLVMAIVEIIKSKEGIIQNRLFRIFIVIFAIEIVVFKVFPNLPFTGTLMNKINLVLQRSIESKNLLSAPGVIRTLFMFGIYYYLHRKVLHRLKKNRDSIKLAIAEKIYYINLYTLLIIPLLGYVPDLWRIQQCVALLSYVEFSWYFSKTGKENLIKRKELIFYGLCIGYALIYLFIIVLKTDQFETVLRALFENNLLVNF